MLIYICCFILGLVIGTVIYKLYSTKKMRVGVLNIDRSDSDGPFLFLELTRDVEYVSKQQKVILHVTNRNYISDK